ncbi:hypothetical protein KFE25_012861 [Diacronema lutheri]|uniref:Dynein heavy chain n=1 Tax=Diacronema lutheri TaxID=2081491 RepID=A0A8J5X6N1_DIALT|nr:hypothetical protein KFE25_012861 [Diacronema lutheri]
MELGSPPATGMSGVSQTAEAAGRQRGFYSETLDPEYVAKVYGGLESAAKPAPRARAAFGAARPGARRANAPRASAFAAAPPDEDALRRKAALGLSVHARAGPRHDAPVRALEPKVLVPYVPGPGRTPRQITIERQKRLFSLQDIRQLLIDEGVEPSAALADGGLPLAIFDDTEFESRPPDEWVSLGVDPATGERRFVPAKYLRRDGAVREAQWVECEVLRYDEPTALFVCRARAAEPADDWVEVRLARIDLLFAAEDPFVFAKRVAAAHRARAEVDALLRRELYVDSMPTEGITALDKERLSRMLALARPPTAAGRAAGRADRPPGVASLLDEVGVDYARAMCSVAFDVLARRAHAAAAAAAAGGGAHAGGAAGGAAGAAGAASAGDGGGLLATVVLPPEPERRRVPARGTVAIDGLGDGQAVLEHSRAFAFATLYSQREAIGALQRVRAECLRVAALNLLHTSFAKSVRLEEFDTAQQQALGTVSAHIKDVWLPALKAGVRHNLKDVGKGWFNLAEKDERVYAVSKLRKLLHVVRLMMQDAIIFLAERSLVEYTAYIEAHASFTVDVRAVNDVRVRPRAAAEAEAADTAANTALAAAGAQAGADAAATPRPRPHAPPPPLRRPPLFLLDLVVKEGAIAWRQPPSAFVDVVMTSHAKAVDACVDIPQLEKAIMENLFWAHAPSLVTISKHEGVPPAVEARLRAALASARPPLDALLATFDGYRPFVALDAAAFIDGYDERLEDGAYKFSVADLKAAVREQLAAADDAARAIPAEVDLGLFVVSASSVCQFVTEKHRELAAGLLQAIGARVRAGTLALHAKFDAIHSQVSRRPRNIEEIAELETYMTAVPVQLDELHALVETVQRDHAVLDEFAVSLPDADFRQLWASVAWHRKVEDRLVQTGEQCVESREQLQAAMLSDQEAFGKELDALERVVNSFGQRFTDLSRVRDAAAEVLRLQDQLHACEAKRTQFNSRESLFSRPITDYAQLGKVNKGFEPYATLWSTAASWLASHQEWLTCPFTRLDPERMRKDVEAAAKAIAKSARHFADTAGLGEVARTIRDQIAAFVPHMPLVEALRNPGMRERHWAVISEATGKTIVVDEAFTLTKMLAMQLEEHEEVIVKECDVAGKEFQIEDSLDTMERAWADVDLEIVAYRETGTFVMRGFDEIQQQLDDHIVMTQTMAFSPYKRAHAERIDAWEGTLKAMSDIFDEWLKVQRSWMYLEPIFSSEDIMRQLPAEGKRFEKVDIKWRKALGDAHDHPHALTFCKRRELLTTFREGNVLLDQVQKGLSDYLETKRQGFSRFYFLSNDELLEILSQTKDPRAVQPHLKKCFENINAIEFMPDLEMVGMYSGEKEYIPFEYAAKPGPLLPTGSVEDWMTRVEQTMKATIRHQVYAAARDYTARPRTEWVKSWPGQIILAGAGIYWSDETAAALRDGGLGGLSEYAKKYHASLMDLTELVRGELTPLQRMSLGALITLDVHARDVLDAMVEHKVASVNDFMWISQLRYAIKDWATPDSVALVIQVDSQFEYGNEYLGNTLRLVVTPLTDRIYLTLTGALSMMLGGAPAGPAGTGKTETTKDLAKALAKQCVVFNCQEGLDYIAMGKFFKGLAMSGAWACFDEFNRIDIEVLSVIAQQLATIRTAMLAKQTRFEFEGSEISLDATNAVFITMNPGYAGRTELPDNLKALFRPVACMVPDYALIGEIRLYSFGYRDARRLARKMVATFRLSSEQLSSQDHYDFGMRAVNTVIQAAGLMRRDHPEMDEDLLLLRALGDSNRPKFLAEDIALFNGIISDLFPGAELPAPSYGELLSAIERAVAELGLQPVDAFIAKCIQLYEVTVLRHGLMLVGPTGGGKSCNKDALALALGSLDHLDRYNRVRISQCNPKSITMGQLYGEFDENTHEWTDGILCTLYRNCVKEYSELGKEDRQWLVFDGPVDALWIESMNTVLDDNKKLCLVSGEIIAMTPCMNVVFEVEDLAVASPATVSRVGIIYMEPLSCVGTAAQTKSWAAAQPAAVQSVMPRMLELCDSLLDRALDFVRRNVRHYVQPVANNLVDSTLRILERCLSEWVPVDGAREVDDDKAALLEDAAERAFFLALVWGVGGACDGEGRRLFDSWLRQTVASDGLGERAAFAEGALVYDYALDLDTNAWLPWMQTMPEFVLSPATPFADIIVPTTDSVRYMWLLERLLVGGHHVLCVGPTGTGKTLNVKDKLMGGMPEAFMPIFVNFSAQTSANQTQDLLDAKLEKRRKGIFGPPSGKRFAVMVDDVNMPKRQAYGAQPPIELLRQWMDQAGWYDRKTLEFRKVIDIVFAGCMGPPGGGRQVVTNRFLRHFNFVAFPELQDESVSTILGTILGAFVGAALQPQLEAAVRPIVSATIDIYSTILKELLPTPDKSHYTFNMRDMASVMQGCLSASPKEVLRSADLYALWIHENERVYADRLVSVEDRAWYDALVRRVVGARFDTEYTQLVPDGSLLLYVDFMVPGADPRMYTRVTDRAQLVRVVDEYLGDYNAANIKKMPLVMFVDAIGHVARVSRVLRQPGGNALLLGVGGSGRQSLARLAGYIQDLQVFQIEISKNYGRAEWRNDVKRLLFAAGEEATRTIFLFSDTQILHESFLEDINNILNTGEVPNLFDENDQNRVAAAMRPICAAAGLPQTKVAMYAQFVKRVQASLHLVIAMSPLGEVFRTRLRNFPSLVNNCTIDWFMPWPDDALREVAHATFGPIAEISDVHKAAIVSMAGLIHLSIKETSTTMIAELHRYNYVTPTSYLELLRTYRTLLARKQTELALAKRRLVTGLDKLASAEVEVATLQTQLSEMQPVLIKTAAQVEEMMEQIQKDKAAADQTRTVVVREEAIASSKAEECQGIKDSAEKDLAEALPALDEAVQCLRDLKLSDISEVAKYANPPGGVKLVVEAICVIRNIPPKMEASADGKGKTANYWEPGKKMLADAKGLLDAMFQFDKDNIPEKTVSRIEPYMNDPNFEPKKIEAVSKSCKAMCQWVRAMYTYHHVAKNVEPKRRALTAAQEELDVLTENLTKLRAALKEVEDKIAELEFSFNQSVAKKESLQRQVDDATVKMDRAGRLLGGLGGEKVRWQATVQALTASEASLVGDVLVAAASVAYIGPFTAGYRADLCATWRTHMAELRLPFSEGVTLMATMLDGVQMRQWAIAGLPSDAVSMENALILSNARRWPLMVDPQGQANKWAKNMERERALEVVKLSDKDFLRTLENAVRFGKPVILENIGEELDPALEPILLKQTFKQSGSEVIKIGDNTIPYHSDFTFYMTTKLANPHYAPETSVKVTLLNFTITQEGLEDQLLGIVVAKERPDLEESKNALVLSNAAMQKQLKEIEDQILRLLSEASGNILDDEQLINTLAQSKVTSDEINAKVAEARTTEKLIDATREGYRACAFRAALLFFCVADMARVDPMYQYSLPWFVSLFARGIADSAPADTVPARIASLNDFFTFSLYDNICRSLFEAHKLLFSFTVCIKVLMGEQLIDHDEWRFLLSGSALGHAADAPNPAPAWVTAQVWSSVRSLALLPAFVGLAESFAAAVPAWKAFFDDNDAHRASLPAPWDDKLSSFQKLLVVRCVRGDKLVQGFQDFVAEQIGQRFIEPPAFNLAASFKESTELVPIVFVLSAGADPMEHVVDLTAEMKMTHKFASISLGQGQGPIAEKMMHASMERGAWVMLQNCHLAISWMPRLEAIVEQYDPETMHKDYRLWLTSMPSRFFPVSILQNSAKVTNEPPTGVKMNLVGSYAPLGDEYFTKSSKPREFKKLLFGTCFFHALVQDRRKFGAIGFNIRYEFTTSDLKCSTLQLEAFLEKYEHVPYQVLEHLTGHINYGGRITDDWDRRLVMAMLAPYMTADILSDTYALAPGELYRSPPAGSHADYLAAIAKLPLNPHPSVFGLHENADIARAQNETAGMCETLLSLQAKVSGGKGKSRDDILADEAKDILDRGLTTFAIDEVMRQYPLAYNESMNTVLSQECKRFNGLLTLLRSSLQDLLKALKGLVVMSEELDLMATSIFNNQVPKIWVDKAYPSLKPLSAWVADLQARVAFISRWIAQGAPPAFWISGFFFPQAFLTGTMQNYARKKVISIDALSWAYDVIATEPDAITEAPADGCYVHGMFIEGARWDTELRALAESRPKVLFEPFPVVWLNPQPDRAKPDAGIYICPVYKTLSRAGVLSTTGHSTNFVLYVELPSRDSCSGVYTQYAPTFSPHWIKRSVALFCSLSY